MSVRILLVADTHLGLGEGHFAAYTRALEHARDVDLVVHGGDVLYRSRVKPGLVFRAFEPLKRVADRGVPVLVVPGNHERSAIPYPLLAMHPGIHIFDRPRTVSLRVNDTRVAISGFPCERNGIRDRFDELLGACGEKDADVQLLALHQSVEGAQVGPVNFTFRNGPDVISRRAIPRRFAAVLAGHIHRHQVLDAGAPVFYPGATERTSYAEAGETKGCVKLTVDRTGVRGWEFLMS
ncbi:MAG: metallophosphoesterase family protein [Thermoanaerobaculia bacterium]